MGQYTLPAYALEYPRHCIGMILRSIFLMEQSEVDWYMTGMRSIFPESWDEFGAAAMTKKTC